jgi:hypothetical protein
MKLKANPGVDYSPAMNAEKIVENEFQAVKAVLSTPLNAAIYMIGTCGTGDSFITRFSQCVCRLWALITSDGICC